MKKFVILGSVNKKLLYPIFLAITLILFNIIDKALNDKISGKIIYSLLGFLSQTLGIMSIRLIPIIFKYKSDDNIKNSKKDYLFLFIISIILFCTIFSSKFIQIDINYDIVNVLCLNEVLDIIILLIITRIFLKYRYYIHILISLLLCCVLGIIIDLILDHYENLKPVDSFYYLEGIAKSVLACYMKYMIDKKYHKYWNINFFMGFVFFILGIIIIIFFCVFNSKNDLYIEFKYFIPIFFANFILSGFLQMSLMIIMVSVLTPNHILVASEIGKMFVLIFSHIQSNDKDNNYFLFLIPFVFQILSLLFYLEILEYNFCDLNKNTKRNIQLREKDADIMRYDSFQSFAEVSPGLIITNTGKELDIFTNNEGESRYESVVL